MSLVSSLTLALLLFLLVETVVYSLSYVLFPRALLGKGLINQPRMQWSALSHIYFQFYKVDFVNRRDKLRVLISTSIYLVAIAILPIRGEYAFYLHRFDIFLIGLFAMGYFLTPAITDFKTPKTTLQPPITLLTIFIGLAGISGLLKGGGVSVDQMGFHFLGFQSVSAFAMMFFLVLFSDFFVAKSNIRFEGAHIISLNTSISHIAWISILIWIFIGASENLLSNFLMYSSFLILIVLAKKFQKYFFREVGVEKEEALLRLFFIPSFLVLLLCIWCERQLWL